MSKAVQKYSRTLLLGLLIALLFTNTLILSPEVGAASDTNKTETNLTLTDNTPTAEDDVLTHRAITMDEAKREAQAAVDEQLAIIAADEEEEEEEEVVIETQTESVDVYEEDDSDSYEAPEATANGSSTKDEVNYTSTPTSTVTASTNGEFLMSIDNPDPNYVGQSIALSDYDRDLCERMVMGEMGSLGFDGMALVAQCIRDTYIRGNYTNIADVLYENGYYGSTSITPSQTCKDVVRYIFDEGGSAVQHRIWVFYATNYCSSPWHESQHYVCSYGYVRFFDSNY